MPIVSAITGSHSASKAADVQAEAARYAADIQKQMFEKGLEVTEPWRQAGMWALEQLVGPMNYLSARYGEKPSTDQTGGPVAHHPWIGLLQGGGGGATGLLAQGPPEFDFSKYMESPWYQFPLQEGEKAIMRRAAAQGKRFSGPTMKNLLRYGQDYAMGMYLPARQQEFNEFISGRLNPMLSLAGLGQVSAGQQASNALSTGKGMAESKIYGGEAQASGILGSAAAMRPLWNFVGKLGANALGALGGGLSPASIATGGSGMPFSIGGGGNYLNPANFPALGW